ncbi:MAG: hypothetical protein V4616_08515 [Bacteroidota bacterium]
MSVVIVFCSVLAMVSGIIGKAYLNKRLLLFFIYSSICAFTEVLLLMHVGSNDNHWIISWFILLETPLLVWALLNLTRDKVIWIFGIAGTLIFTVIWLSDAIHIGVERLSIWGLTAQGILFSILSVIVLLQTMLEPTSYSVKPEFWILIGVFVFFGTSLGTNICYLFVTGEKTSGLLGKYLLYSLTIGNIVTYLLYSIGFLCNYPSRRQNLLLE